MKNLYITLSFVLAGSMSLTAQNKDTAKADKLYNRFEYVDAASEYLKLTEKGKGDGYVYKQLGESYYNVFSTTEAERWYGQAIKAGVQDAETYFRYAQMLKANSKYEESNKQMQHFASLVPNDQRAIAFKAEPNYLPALLKKTKQYTVKGIEINSEYSDFGPVLVDKTLYFTSARNTSRKTYGWNDQPYLDIYQSTYNEDGTFSKAEPVSALNSKYHDGPVTVSADGKTAYFSSESFKEKLYEKDKKANTHTSQVNLFKATRSGEQWGNITPLPFNSKDYSVSNPSLSKDGKTLYFASDMPGSLGDSDIWKVEIKADGSFGTPENLGKKVNTEAKESFPFIADNGVLYFASNGRQGFGGLDVFSIDLAKGKEAVNMGKPVNSEKDDFGFSFNTAQNVGFYASNVGGNDDIYKATPICDVEVLATVTDSKTGRTLSGATVSILDEKKSVVGTETSQSDGSVEYRVACDKAYTIQVSKPGYENGTFAVAKTKGGALKVSAPINPIEEIIKETEVVLNDIIFEFDKSNITREGAYELDKLVEAMKAKPELVILVKGHTDSRGSDEYNLKLSDRRAKSTVQYILSKGIAKGRISGKGVGESEPKVDCGDTCTEEQHKLNRRSEFLIVK